MRSRKERNNCPRLREHFHANRFSLTCTLIDPSFLRENGVDSWLPSGLGSRLVPLTSSRVQILTRASCRDPKKIETAWVILLPTQYIKL